MNQRRSWFGVVFGGGAFAALAGGAIYYQNTRIEQAREKVGQMREEIVASRRLIEGTAALERDVIVLREISEVIKGILPDTADVNNLVHTLQDFSEQTSVAIRSLKKKPEPRGPQRQNTAFDQVGYTLTFDADSFQFLDFLDRIETHSRFMRVPLFKINAAKRSQVEVQGQPRHSISLDVETFVYEPTRDAKPVRIESYERKRDLMFGEINRRRQDLTLATYTYPGARGRRDPWVDPRVPIMGDGESALTVQEQMDVVNGLHLRTQAVLAQWETVKEARNVIEEMMARADLEEMLAMLEEDVRRIENEGAIRYIPSQRRLQLEVVDVIFELRRELTSTEGVRGPSLEKLREVHQAMLRHMEREEFDLMLDTFRYVDDQLEYVTKDPLRKPYVDELRRLARIARTVREFDRISINVSGVAIMEGAPSIALINGRPVGVGDLVGNELLVREIRVDEIEFIYRGIVLARRF